MITINKSIEDVVASKNPVWVEATTDNYVLNEGTNQLLFIGSPNQPIENEVWTFKIKDFEFSIVWKNTPDKSGFEILRNIANQAEANTVAFDQIDNAPNFVLYEISTFLISRPGFNPSNWIEITLSVSWENAPLEFIGTSNGMNAVNASTSIVAVPRSVRPDFRVLCAIYNEFETPSFPFTFRFSPPYVLDSNPNDDSNVAFNLMPALNQMVEFYKAPLNAAAFSVATGASKNFFYRLEEQYAEDGKQTRRWPVNVFPQAPTEDTVLSDHDGTYFVAVHGKMPLLSYSEQNYFLGYGKPDVDRKFLTLRPKESTLHITEPVWLYYIQTEEYEVELHAKIYLANGGIDQSMIVKETLGVDDGENVHVVCVGVANNSLLKTFINNRDVVKYEVWLEREVMSVNERITEIMTFVIEDRDFQEINYLLFENPLGGLDTFRVTGNIIAQDESTGEIVHLAEKQLQSKSFIKMVNNLRQGGFSIFSGIRKSIAEIEWARQIQSAENVTLLRKGEEFKLIVLKDQKDIWSLKESIFSIELKVKLAHYD
jgi:hypothetical protein